jgi:hypothetical protein
MKKLVLLILIVFTGLSILAQSEIYLSPALVAAGGNTGGIPDGSTITLSRWKLSKIPVITLYGDYSQENQDLVSEESDHGWNAKLYPNPVRDNLNVEFELTETMDFIIKLADLTGRVLMIRKSKTTFPLEIIKLDMSGFSSALYLLHISTLDQMNSKIYRIQKI